MSPPTFAPLLRTAQRQALAYPGGAMGISAVPGSGKTYTLEVLIADLILNRGVAPERIGAFTYMRSSRANLTFRVNRLLQEHGVTGRLEALTLHALALRILKNFTGRLGVEEVQVLEAYEQERIITRATNDWLRGHTRLWEPLLPPQRNPEWIIRNRLSFAKTFRGMCRAVIRTAKNYRTAPEKIQARPEGFLCWALPVYREYQSELTRRGLVDYDDLGGRALALMEQDSQVLAEVQSWYDYILEDESQDSSPLQEQMLAVLSSRTGNLVRVGDPNQSIMGTFTTAEPRLFRAFCATTPPVILSESSRSAPRILDLANALVAWSTQDHPLAYLREAALAPQYIQPATTGPANPTNQECAIDFEEIPGSVETEIESVVQWSLAALSLRPDQTIAILVTTNDLGTKALEALKRANHAAVDLLRGNPSQRRITESLKTLADLFAQPADLGLLQAAYQSLGGGALPALPAEQLLFPSLGLAVKDPYLKTLARWLKAARAPWPYVLRLVVQELARDPSETFTGNYVVDQLERTLDQPTSDWRMVADELALILESGLNNFPAEVFSFSPQPGTVTVATVHRAKGLEFDEVYLTGLSAYDYPVVAEDHRMGLRFLDDLDMQAEAEAELRRFLGGHSALYSPTEQAFLDLAAERLRLLYVGITRAKRRLTLTVATEKFGKEQKPSLLFTLLRTG